MPDMEKVIKWLTNCVAVGLETACPLDCPYFPQCFPDVGPASPFMPLMQDALDLLKEQEAVKPTWSRGKPFCGACGLRIHGGKFCSECGKPILWEGR